MPIFTRVLAALCAVWRLCSQISYVKHEFMKLRTPIIVFFALALFTAATSFSCSRKTGCPAYEEVHVKRNKKGKPKERGTSNLFPKKMRKRGGGK